MSKLQMVLRQVDHAAVRSLEKAIRNAEKRGEGLTLLIDCKGGSIDEGFQIIELIKASPVRIEGLVTGEAGSMAAVILEACHYRAMKTTSTLHFHYGSWRVSFLIYYDEARMEANRKSAIAKQSRMSAIIMQKSGMTEAEVHNLLRQDKHMPPDDALEHNLIDEIRIVESKVAS